MNAVNKFLQRGDASSEERHPIMTTTEMAERQSHGAISQHQHQKPPARDGSAPARMTYETLSEARLQDPGGGYVGPAGLPEVACHPEDGPPSSTAHHPDGSQTGRTPENTTARWFWRQVGGRCCDKRTEHDPGLLVLLALLLLLLVALLCLIVTSGVWSATDVMSQTTCTTAACAEAASDILRSLNEEVEPCEDFAEFACGGWRRGHSIPEGKFQWTVFSALDEHLRQTLKEMLETQERPEEPRTIRTAKTFYQACVNDSAWQQVGLAPLLQLLEEEGGLPMLDPDWEDENFHLTRSLARLQRGFVTNSLVSLTVEPDSLNTSVRVLCMSEGALPVKREYLIHDSPTSKALRVNHIRHMTLTGRELLKERKQNLNQTRLNTLDKDIEDLWHFYVEVAKITSPSQKRHDPWLTYNPMTVAELQAITDAGQSSLRVSSEGSALTFLTVRSRHSVSWSRMLIATALHSELVENAHSHGPPQHLTRSTLLLLLLLQVDWLEYLREVFRDTNITITAQERIIVDRPAYYRQLRLLLQDTPARTIANYLLFQLVKDIGGEATSHQLTTLPERTHPRALLTRFLGRTTSRPWYDCSWETMKILPLAVASLYVRHQRNNPSSITMVREMVVAVSKAFRVMLSSTTWMDEPTREAALRKLDEMNHLVAFPDLVLDDDHLEDYHKGLPSVSRGDHFGNVVALMAWISHRVLLSLRLTTDMDRWLKSPLEPNAFYAALQNAILIPVGMLQPPVSYNQDLTPLIYGTLGSAIGHEIMHGFDNHGRQRDWRGNLRRWWTNQTLAAYHNKTHCFTEQYSAFDATHLILPEQREGREWKVNGLTTLGENIADNGGMRVAWLAYKAKGGGQWSLPGLQHYTHDQLFFISYGKLWCTRHSSFSIKFILGSDPHSPSYYRILGPLQNFPEFAQAFNCSLDSPMNPRKKCQLF